MNYYQNATFIFLINQNTFYHFCLFTRKINAKREFWLFLGFDTMDFFW